MKSRLLVTIQFLLIAFISGYTGLPNTRIAIGLIICGTALGLWAVTTMQFAVNIFPEVRSGQKLFTNGPYKWIRHPMYTSVLLTMLGFAIKNSDAVSMVAWVVLNIDLNVKLKYEEGELKKKFNEYGEYMKITKRLIPLVY